MPEFRVVSAQWNGGQLMGLGGTPWITNSGGTGLTFDVPEGTGLVLSPHIEISQEGPRRFDRYCWRWVDAFDTYWYKSVEQLYPGDLPAPVPMVPFGWHHTFWGVTIELWACSGGCSILSGNEKLLDAGILSRPYNDPQVSSPGGGRPC